MSAAPRDELKWLTRRPIAHRGLHDMNKKVWENTLPAFSAAIAGNYAIECDVHLTKDGEVIVFHDDVLDRLAGREGRICDLTLAEAQALTIGTTQDHAPSLRQMLDLVAGRVPLVIELKGIEGQDEGLVAAVAKELKTYQREAAIMSFDHHLIRRFRSDAPGVAAGLTAEGTSAADMEKHFAMLAHDVDFVSYNFHHLPNPFISFFRTVLNRPVITWTVRNAEEKAVSDMHAQQITFEGFIPDSAIA